MGFQPFLKNRQRSEVIDNFFSFWCMIKDSVVLQWQTVTNQVRLVSWLKGGVKWKEAGLAERMEKTILRNWFVYLPSDTVQQLDNKATSRWCWDPLDALCQKCMSWCVSLHVCILSGAVDLYKVVEMWNQSSFLATAENVLSFRFLVWLKVRHRQDLQVHLQHPEVQ